MVRGRTASAPRSFAVFGAWLGVVLMFASGARADTSSLSALADEYTALGSHVMAASMTPELRAALRGRIDDGLRSLSPSWFATHPELLEEKRQELRLDTEVVAALGDRREVPFVDSAALAVAVINDGAGDPIPIAYRMPAAHLVGHAPPIVVMLPGAEESETDLASRTLIGDLSRDTGSIVAVIGKPNGGVDQSFDDPKVLDAVIDRTIESLGADDRRVYLAGVSFGADRMFHFVARAPRRYAAYLALDGLLSGADAPAAFRHLSNSPVFLVAGAASVQLPAKNVRSVVTLMRRSHIFARYYEAPQGGESLISYASTFTAAWDDMVSGVQAVPDDGLGNISSDTDIRQR